MPSRPKLPVIGPKPVYVSLSAVEDVLVRLHRHGMPFSIDEVTLQHFSASMRRQVLAALKFLRLVDGRGYAQPLLGRLVAAHDTAAWPKVLAEVLHAAYKPLLEHPIDQMTADAFGRLFRTIYPSTEDVSRKSITFFISAMRAAQIPLNEHLLDGRRVRRPNKHGCVNLRTDGQVKATSSAADALDRRRAASGIDEGAPIESTGDYHGRGTDRGAIAFLTDLLDQSRMTQTEQEAIWTLVKFVNRSRDPRALAA